LVVRGEGHSQDEQDGKSVLNRNLGVKEEEIVGEELADHNGHQGHKGARRGFAAQRG
jgi:hypothetical protein